MDRVDMFFWGGIILTFFALGVVVYFVHQEEEQQQKEVERCFVQEPRTKECELVLYKYENRKKNTTTAVPVFMPIAR